MAVCFAHDEYFHCEVNDESSGLEKEAVKCYECHAWIWPGEIVHSVYQQEHEMCQRCEDDSADNEFIWEPDSEECAANKHDYGEVFEAHFCDKCHKLFEVIVAHEESEGCKGYEAHPGYGGLREAMVEDDLDDDQYSILAAKMYPGLAVSGHLDRLGREYKSEEGWSLLDLEPVEIYGGEG